MLTGDGVIDATGPTQFARDKSRTAIFWELLTDEISHHRKEPEGTCPASPKCWICPLLPYPLPSPLSPLPPPKSSIPEWAGSRVHLYRLPSRPNCPTYIKFLVRRKYPTRCGLGNHPQPRPKCRRRSEISRYLRLWIYIQRFCLVFASNSQDGSLGTRQASERNLWATPYFSCFQDLREA